MARRFAVICVGFIRVRHRGLFDDFHSR
jgi:hypothetical protein